jgi:hypothetical protein
MKMRSSLLGRINYIFNNAKRHHETFYDILNNLKFDVYDSEYWKKIPQYEHYYIRGFIDAQFKYLDDNCIEWLHYHPILGMVKNIQIPAGEWHIVDSKKSGFYWIGTNKPYNTKIYDYSNKS